MRILPVSDLHFEYHADQGASLIAELDKNVDVLVVAGDLANADSVFDALRRLSDAYQHVVYVPGNHDWFHGHTHESSDYMFGKTRVLCNPFGYPRATNRAFRANLIVEV